MKAQRLVDGYRSIVLLHPPQPGNKSPPGVYRSMAPLLGVPVEVAQKMSTWSILFLDAGAVMSLSMRLRIAPSAVEGVVPLSEAATAASREAKLICILTLNATPNPIMPVNIVRNTIITSENSTSAWPRESRRRPCGDLMSRIPFTPDRVGVPGPRSRRLGPFPYRYHYGGRVAEPRVPKAVIWLRNVLRQCVLPSSSQAPSL